MATGGRTADTIIPWVKKKSGPPAVTIASKEDAEKLLENEVAVIGFFEVSALIMILPLRH
jgi:protein disulfide-isomerase A1